MRTDNFGLKQELLCTQVFRKQAEHQFTTIEAGLASGSVLIYSLPKKVWSAYTLQGRNCRPTKLQERPTSLIEEPDYNPRMIIILNLRR